MMSFYLNEVPLSFREFSLVSSSHWSLASHSSPAPQRNCMAWRLHLSLFYAFNHIELFVLMNSIAFN